MKNVMVSEAEKSARRAAFNKKRSRRTGKEDPQRILHSLRQLLLR